jgi:hypothetical protein
MSRREIIRNALEEDWGADAEVPSPGSTWAARDVARESGRDGAKPSVEIQALLDEYVRRRVEGHQAGCLCHSRDGFLGCIELRRLIAKAGEWRVLYE